MVTKQLLINYDSVYQNNDRHAIIKDLTDLVRSTTWGNVLKYLQKSLCTYLYINSIFLFLPIMKLKNELIQYSFEDMHSIYFSDRENNVFKI